MVENCIKEYREKLGLSQEQLSAKSGVPRSTIGEIENGKHAVTLEAALRLSEALGEPVEKLFTLVK